MRRTATLLLGLLVPAPAAAQQHPDARAATNAYREADFGGAVTAARRALRATLSASDRAAVYEVLGYAYAALDSSRQATDAFKELIFIAPDREPDPNVVSPRITSLYASALGQVLVVRRAAVDSATFVAGQGTVPIRFQVSRAARVIVRAEGQGVDIRIDSLLAAGTTRTAWDALLPDGTPVPAGDYRVIVTATEGRNEYATPLRVRIEHGAVDTVPHLARLEGYAEQEEYVRPPRDWRPLGIAALIAGAGVGASLALENQDLGSSPRREIGGASLLTLGIGLVMSLRRPDPEPVEANIRYNRLLREQLAQQNAQIAAENVLRRRQVQLTIAPGGAP
ncbi:MAG: hypothetical protein OER21_10700 [Gemmatimonadota bacterium]|nr:hypothetical protein [Gemmatimonadota bacterium]